jgi:hypothetical protein
MLDPKVVTKLVEDQIAATVNAQVLEVLASDAWLADIEQKVIQYAQNIIVKKFANSAAVPEILSAVKDSVGELFQSGQVPGIEQYVDQQLLRQVIDQSVQQMVQSALDQMVQDTVWLSKIENTVNQVMVQRTVAGLTALDINSVIHNRVDETMEKISKTVVEQLSTTGIQDLANNCELSVLDGHVVVENKLTAKLLDVVDSISVSNLAVTGSINTDNQAWNTLSDNITEKTLDKLSESWRNMLVQQVSEQIQQNGIDFDQVNIDGHSLIAGGRLAHSITESSLKSVGILHNLQVAGEATINDTVNVKKKRLGINTHEPEMALSVWDEEVSILAGKIKDKSAYIGTGRAQSLNIGVNRSPAIEIDVDGLTAIKQLRVGVHRLSHGTEVPNYSGTKGDIVFNANPSINNNVFAWQCLGGFKWKIIRSVE